MIVEPLRIKNVACSRHRAVSPKKPLSQDPFHLGLDTAGKIGDAFVASQEKGLDDHICVCHLHMFCKQFDRHSTKTILTWQPEYCYHPACKKPQNTVVHTLVAQCNIGCAEAALATVLSAESFFVSRLHTVTVSTV